MQQTDVKSAHYTGATGTPVASRCRLKGIMFLGDATAGDAIFRDGGALGPIKLQFNLPSNSNNVVTMTFPGEGILFETNVYVSIPGTASSITVFYG